MKIIAILFFALLITHCSYPPVDNKPDTKNQEQIIQKYLLDSARQYSYNAPQWDYFIDKGLAEDSTIAYLWQQKAMPLFKKGKYQLGMVYLDKAVLYDSAKWLSYRAFIKCIFSKSYNEAILDFEEAIKMDGNSYVMDHSYLFYIALSKLQLNKFVAAESLLKLEIDRIAQAQGETWVHHLDLFYYGIALYEQQKYAAAILAWDRALARYPKFADAQYYKAYALFYLDKEKNKEAYSKLFNTAIANLKNGYTINEDNAIYERYPYQLRIAEITQ